MLILHQYAELISLIVNAAESLTIIGKKEREQRIEEVIVLQRERNRRRRRGWREREE